MKIYNRKGLIWGIVWTLLAVFNLTHEIISPNDFLMGQIKDVLFSVALLIIGIVGFVRAFSKQATREDKVEEADERNRLVALKSKARAFDILQAFLLVAVVVFAAAYKITGNIAWIPFLIAVAVLWNISFLLDIIASIYYEKHS
ncbi:DUF2178 domain-containing protein [Faecalispora anaeroviscerum]|uniref:DUF2178 domain-containing protein n=1 Tax=Faecalispora anaeroviscerum TaxID=2991836 RepID=UPI0024BB0458|nr:DUF2178 domain-containing protein [Faecalispora anaeroviscerum]